MAYGTVTINGKTYIEREQNFPLEIGITVAAQVITPTLVLPGTADFWLKALTRETMAGVPPVGASAARRFRFRLGNSDGNTWYSSGGAGGTTDRVIDTLIFGSGQFPYVISPHIFYAASGSIRLEIEDLAGAALVPYTIFLDFRGSYLIPAGS